MDCDFALEQFTRNMAKVNIYDMYRLYDYDNDNVTAKGKTIVNGQEVEYERGFTMAQYTPWLKFAESSKHRLGYTAADFLNRQNVRDLLHISPKVLKWEACTSDPQWKYNFQPEGSTYIYDILKAAGYRILVYSGTTDLAVATLGTHRWINELGWKVKRPWHQWHVK